MEFSLGVLSAAQSQGGQLYASSAGGSRATAKIGLTFAIETPIESWQRSVNKVVGFDKVVAIIKEAKRYGFKSAKFYFMIGLPLPERGSGEGEAIVDFLSRLMAEVPIAMNVNTAPLFPSRTPPMKESGR
jgi:radical SAM superfamily enzyme YgiQ (UPF0313 family)